MKKLVSLLLAVMLVMSMMTFSVSASEDKAYVPNTEEDKLGTGLLTTDANYGYYAKYVDQDAGVEVVLESDESENKVFKIAASSNRNNGSSLLALRPTGLGSSSAVNRFVSNIKLSDTTDADGMVGVHQVFAGWTASSPNYTGCGVFLTGGGAQYYDPTTGMHINFVDAGTMLEDTWYTIETIVDTRAATTSADTCRVYMNAFVYETETGERVGTSGWQYVDNTVIASGCTAYRNVLTQAWKYDSETYVYVDDFTAYEILDLPEYQILDNNKRENVTVNQYIAYNMVASGNAGNYFRTAVDAFNKSTSALITSEGNTAARIEIDFRVPAMDEAARYDLLSFNAGLNSVQYAKNGALPSVGTKANNQNTGNTGTVQLNNNVLTVNSFNSELGVYDADVPLTVGNGEATGLTLSANTWYTLVWDIDFFPESASNPKAMLYVKSSDGTVLAQSKAMYDIQPLYTNAYNQTTITYCGTLYKKDSFHIDNTNIYVATTYENLNSTETRTVRIEDDFETYNNGDDLFAVLTSAPRNIGTTYYSYIKTTNTYPDKGIHVAQDLFVEELSGFDFVEGKEFDSTEPIGLKFDYTQPIPRDNIESNIEVYANNVLITEGYDITYGEANEDDCVDYFVLNFTHLQWDTTYTIRLKAGLADCNASGNTPISSGVPADSGLYRDWTFKTPEININYAFDLDILNDADEVYASTALSKDDVIKGSVEITNDGEKGQISCYGILAIYDGTKLVDIRKTELITAPAGEVTTQTTETYVAEKDGLTAKLFVWNTFELMTPWITPTLLGQ